MNGKVRLPFLASHEAFPNVHGHDVECIHRHRNVWNCFKYSVNIARITRCLFWFCSCTAALNCVAWIAWIVIGDWYPNGFCLNFFLFAFESESEDHWCCFLVVKLLASTCDTPSLSSNWTRWRLSRQTFVNMHPWVSHSYPWSRHRWCCHFACSLAQLKCCWMGIWQSQVRKVSPWSGLFAIVFILNHFRDLHYF